MKVDLTQPPDKVNEQNGAMLHERRAVSLRYSTASDYYLQIRRLMFKVYLGM